MLAPALSPVAGALPGRLSWRRFDGPSGLRGTVLPALPWDRIPSPPRDPRAEESALTVAPLPCPTTPAYDGPSLRPFHSARSYPPARTGNLHHFVGVRRCRGRGSDAHGGVDLPSLWPLGDSPDLNRRARLVLVRLLLVRLVIVELLLATVLVVPVPTLPLLLVAGQFAELLAALPLFARCLPSLLVLLPLPLL